jgi:hypothetical protein
MELAIRNRFGASRLQVEFIFVSCKPEIYRNEEDVITEIKTKIFFPFLDKVVSALAGGGLKN